MTNKADFINQMYQAALQAGLSDAAARVMAAQSGIESGYGERAPGFNYFAITKGPDWNGPTVTRTDKDSKGNPVQQQFRVYDSPQAGIADRISYMDNHFPGFSQAPTVDAALATLQNGKYGKYYQAPQATYEKAVTGINHAYLPTAPASVPNTSAKASLPASDNASNGLKIVDVTNGGSIGKGTVPANPFASRQRNGQIEGLIFHHSGGEGLAGAMTAGQGSGLQHGTGAQFYIDKDGTIYRYAPDSTAMVDIRNPGNKFRTDAGKPTAGLSNDNTLGVEIIGADSSKFTQAQKDSAAALAKYLSTTYKINPTMIVGHGDIQGGPGGNKQPTEGVQVAQFARDYIGGKIPPMNIPQIGTELSTTPDGMPPLPRPRPNAVLNALGAPAGDRSKDAMANTSTLGWVDGQHVVDGETVRGTLKPADYARARLTADSVGGVGSVSDPNLSALTVPQPPALQRALARLAAAGGTVSAGTGANGSANLSAATAPTPMPGRPADVIPAATQQAPVQTIRVGKHDYQVGQTFDQGGMHYVVTPTGIESSRIQSGEPTVMSGIVGNVLKSSIPEVQAGINSAAGKVGQNFSEMGTNLTTSANKVGASLSANAGQIGNSLSATFGGLGSMFSGGNPTSSAFLGSTGSGALTAPFVSEDHPRSNSSKPLMDNIGYGPTQGGIDAMSRTYVPAPKNGYIESSPVQNGANYTTAMTGWNGPLGKNITVAPLPSSSVTLPASLSRTTGGNVLQSHGNALNANVFSGSAASGNVRASSPASRVSAVPTMTLAQYNQRQQALTQQIATSAKAVAAPAVVHSNALQAPTPVQPPQQTYQQAQQDLRNSGMIDSSGMLTGSGGHSMWGSH